MYRVLSALILLALLGAGLASAPRQSEEMRVSPALLQLASDNPASSVGIIVQTFADRAVVAGQVAELGGKVTRELPIINGFAANLAAGAIPQLGRNASVRWISPDTPVLKTNCDSSCYNSATVSTAYPKAVGAPLVWNRTTPLRGRGIGVAVIDSGVYRQGDLYLRNTATDRMIVERAFNPGHNQDPGDAYGHGTHVAGIIAGNGNGSGGKVVGIAPEVNIINVKVSDDLSGGIASTSSVVAGLQWVYDNRNTYNIRVVSISLTDSVVESYHVSALAAAVELLWFNKIVVVAAAGNTGDKLAAPANDPFIITVGAIDDRGTASISDDSVPSWSASGTTIDGFSKPDIGAPGVGIVSLTSQGSNRLQELYPNNVVTINGYRYFRMSGTSMAAPVVVGAIALLLQDEPNLTPDQVKFRLRSTATAFGGGRVGAGYLNIQRAIDGTSTASANTNIQISKMLQDGSNSTVWNSASWSTAKWSTAKWSTAKWSTAKWSTAR